MTLRAALPLPLSRALFVGSLCVCLSRVEIQMQQAAAMRNNQMNRSRTIFGATAAAFVAAAADVSHAT
jgi:hypothetical protein